MPISYVNENLIVSGNGALTMPAGSTAQRPAGSQGMVRYNSTLKRPEWYNPVMGVWDAFGTVTSPTIDLLVVGGGGAGGSGHTGNLNGGAGGARSYNASVSIAVGTQYAISVGAGGDGWTSANPGAASSAFGFNAAGGAARVNAAAGPNGSYYAAFAGFGQSGYFGGGGGYGGASGTIGGLGGGGRGAGSSTGLSNAESGAPNTGGGGGGGNSSYNASGGGGSGVVLIRYPDIYPAASEITGSPTVIVTGGYRYYQFTNSGSFTF